MVFFRGRSPGSLSGSLPLPLLIGTDEAGYGPPLGPLVIVATAWRFPAGSTAEDAFLPLADGLELAEGCRLRIGDSKQLFKRSGARPLAGLETAVAALLPHRRPGQRATTLEELLAQVCGEDLAELATCPWFANLEVPYPLPSDDTDDPAEPAGPPTRDLVQQALSRLQIELVDVAARVIDARRFNRMCESFGNKATLLSETTAELVCRCIDSEPQESQVLVYSDRHGGRHRYGALLQHSRPDAMLRIVSEAAAESRYQLCEGGRTIDWRFTIKGDRFAPVACASMVAKYLRERMMERFNAFWRQHHGESLRPTAGYATDAGRFCRQIRPTAARLGIHADGYVRCR